MEKRRGVSEMMAVKEQSLLGSWVAGEVLDEPFDLENCG